MHVTLHLRNQFKYVTHVIFYSHYLNTMSDFKHPLARKMSSTASTFSVLYTDLNTLQVQLAHKIMENMGEIFK